MINCLIYRHKKQPMRNVGETEHMGNGWMVYERASGDRDEQYWDARIKRFSKHFPNHDWRVVTEE